MNGIQNAPEPHNNPKASPTPERSNVSATAHTYGNSAQPALNLALDALEDSYGLTPPVEAIEQAFTQWVHETGKEMYPHQEDALTAILCGDHVIASTPTGSGKSMIAMQALFAALATGKTGYYTAPLKALVSEKFFELISLFGAHNVGMVTGDVSINAQAPIICATAEILANIALREGSNADVGIAIADEFHYYADPERGWAWQVPLLELTDTQHVLLSATLGDTSWLEKDLEARTGRSVSVINNAQRPVPLHYTWSLDPLSVVIRDLVATHMAPVYVVYFSQREAVAGAQGFLGVSLLSRERKELIAQALHGYHFTAGFGKTLSKLLRAGIGIHHAGLLPRYRRLVERLAQRGLLAVICGTDTLGVGINVPIRTVVLSSLTKFDGSKMRHLTAREFHQISGRAGRAGFDTVGYVYVQAPEYEIENERRRRKAGDDPTKLKRVQKVQPEEGQLQWSISTFEKLRDKEPETLTSRFRINHSIILHLLQRPDPVHAIWNILLINHESPSRKRSLITSMFETMSSLEIAGVIQRRACEWPELTAQGLAHVDDLNTRLETIKIALNGTNIYTQYLSALTASDQIFSSGTDTIEHPPVFFTKDVPDDFALNAPLSPFALSALELFDPDSDSYALDVLSVIESVQEAPMPILYAQQKRERSRVIDQLKADGVEYAERMNIADSITWPEPCGDILKPALASYAESNPWVRKYDLVPKSIVREMIETASTFTEFISSYGVQRSEGLLLRYLTDTYRAMRQIIPASARNEEIDAIISWLGKLIRSVDSSLLDEWEALANGNMSDSSDQARDRGNNPDDSVSGIEMAFGADPDGVCSFTRNKHALRTAIRNELFTVILALERDDLEWIEDSYQERSLIGEQAEARRPLGVSLEQLDQAAQQYWDEYEYMGIDTAARSASFVKTIEDPSLADLIHAGVDPDLGAELLENHKAGRLWLICQIIDDGQGENSWGLWALADLDVSDELNQLALYLIGLHER